ncbi:MAG: (Fe-S)-binding protein [Chloroflexaceae bacterium]
MEAEMRRFVESLERQLTPEDIVNLEACMDCKLCGNACAWYLGTNEEKLHPTYKTNFVRDIYKRYMTIEGKVAGAMGLIPTPTVADLREHMEYFWKCTACGRCTLACPAGISTRSLVRMARAAYTDAGLSRENPTLNSIIENLETKMHSFGLSREQILARYSLFLCSQNIEMAVDIEGADILFVCPSAANTKIPDYATKIMAILNAADVNYTVSSRLLETGTEADHVIVHHELARMILEAWEAEAERLGVQQVMVAECGCDTRSLFFEATELLGRPFKFPIILFDPMILEYIKDGRLPVEKVDSSITLHDPCHSTRLAGIGDAMRELLNRLTTNFIEMTPNREYNYCCNGGAGGMRLPENAPVRRQVSTIKANQIKNSGADYVTTPCVVCMLTLDDTCQTYNLGKNSEGTRAATMLFEVLYEAMYKALEQRGELDRMRTPIGLQNCSAAYFQEHSAAGKVACLMQHEEAASVLAWLEADAVVQRFFAEHPEGVAQLETFKALHARAQEGEVLEICERVVGGAVVGA